MRVAGQGGRLSQPACSLILHHLLLLSLQILCQSWTQREDNGKRPVDSVPGLQDLPPLREEKKN